MNKMNIFLLALMLLFMAANFESCDLGPKSIEYTFENLLGDTVTVEVLKGEGANSSFSESGGAWYVRLEGLDPIRLNVEGTIAGYVWTFTNLTGTGPNVTVTGTGGRYSQRCSPRRHVYIRQYRIHCSVHRRFNSDGL